LPSALKDTWPRLKISQSSQKAKLRDFFIYYPLGYAPFACTFLMMIIFHYSGIVAEELLIPIVLGLAQLPRLKIFFAFFAQQLAAAMGLIFVVIG
jgi:hypothetical protein